MLDKPKPPSNEPHEKIVEIAKKHFALHGYQGANLKDIAAEAKVAGSLINYHFDGKEGLFEACMEPFARRRMEAILRILGSANTRDEIKVRIQLFTEEMMASYVADPYSFEIVDREVRAANPIIMKIWEQTMLKAFKAVVAFFQEAEKNGLLREGVDPFIASALLFTSCCDSVRKEGLAKRFFNLSFHDAAWRARFSQHIVNLFTEGALK
ncbi:MAG: TetR/AcrR family transcriptional regulator [Bdellovibrionales bacterium]